MELGVERERERGMRPEESATHPRGLHGLQRPPLPSEAEVIAEVTQGGKGARISLLSVEEQFLAEIDLFPCISHPHPTSSSSHQKLFEFKGFHLSWV